VASATEKKRAKLRLAVSNARPVRPAPLIPSLDDTQLLDALRAGDPTAAAALHDRVQPVVDRTVARLLGRRDVDHEDLSQLALIEIVYGIDLFRGECSLDSWCSAISAHVVYKHIRRRQIERRIFELGDGVEDVPSSRSDGRDLSIRSIMRRVHTHLATIEENKAWTYLLHDVFGYDLREIAKITGVTMAAAQTRLTRGRRELHERIAADPELAPMLETDEGSS
jgi:RNA polymerase sigma-70 factor (ECF subfamily)